MYGMLIFFYYQTTMVFLLSWYNYYTVSSLLIVLAIFLLPAVLLWGLANSFSRRNTKLFFLNIVSIGVVIVALVFLSFSVTSTRTRSSLMYTSQKFNDIVNVIVPDYKPGHSPNYESYENLPAVDLTF